MYKGERFSGYSHLLGSVLAVAGLVMLMVTASRDGDPWKIVSVAIYGSTLVLLFSFSTLYHSLKGRAKSIFRKFDHVSIYVLIAGTYTPFTLVTLRSTWGWTLFGMVWALAILGTILDILHRQGSRALQMAIYLIMGWLVIIAMPQLMDALPTAGIAWLVAGGLFYTVGIIFYAIDERMRHAHGIWHLFVLAGSISHYMAVFFYVV
ncbi:MAG: hemolysin III family protein [Mariprofundaceae bacterium]|nr:hemolysin III family protein [Mariprofundaceae bacterium]